MPLNGKWNFFAAQRIGYSKSCFVVLVKSVNLIRSRSISREQKLGGIENGGLVDMEDPHPI